MISHASLGSNDEERSTQVRLLIAKGKIKWGGYKLKRIYGTLDCATGKRMKVENRVFFRSETEAVQAGYRPCGHCMKNQYHKWKAKQKNEEGRA